MFGDFVGGCGPSRRNDPFSGRCWETGLAIAYWTTPHVHTIMTAKILPRVQDRVR